MDNVEKQHIEWSGKRIDLDDAKHFNPVEKIGNPKKLLRSSPSKRRGTHRLASGNVGMKMPAGQPISKSLLRNCGHR